MNCPLKSDDTLDLLLDYSAGKLDRARSAPLEEHMAVCEECAAFRIGQAEVWQALDTWETEPVGMDFNRRMWRKIDAAAVAPWYRKLADSLRMGAWKPAVPLAAIAVLVAVGFGVDHNSAISVTPGVGNASGVSITEADQVERTLDDIQLLRQLDAAAGNDSDSSRPM